MSKSEQQEAFVIYHKGVELQLRWMGVPPLIRSPAARLCVLDNEYSLLLTEDNCLYLACKCNASILNLELERTDVLDVDYCWGTQQLFIVTTMGVVLMQQLSNTIGYRTNVWQELVFDPLELVEDGVCVQGVCCTERGALFVCNHHEIYVMGSCGDIFTAESQPKHFRVFENCAEIIDAVAGDEFFIILLQRLYADNEDCLGLHTKTQASRKIDNHHIINGSANSSTNDTSKEPDKKSDLNSNSSIRSFSSKSSHSHFEPDFESTIEKILKKGYSLINTQVHTFGAINRGLLGTGDHIKRPNINLIHKLDAIGVRSIAAGKEHSVASTLDGRVYHWGHNSKQQLIKHLDIADISAPKELKFDDIILSSEQANIVEACCGDFQTILLRANEEMQSIVSEKVMPLTSKDLLTIEFHSPDIVKKPLKLVLSSGTYTIRNLRQFQRDYFGCYHDFQQQMRLLLKYRHAVHMLEMFQQKSTASAIKQMEYICLNYEKILYLLAAALSSLKCFYMRNFDNAMDVLFIKYYRECLELFEQYSKAFCDIYSIDGYAEAGKVFAHLSSAPLMPDQRDNLDLMRIFEQPLKIYMIFIKFLEKLVKDRDEFKEHLLAWQTFECQARIAQEIAESTQSFWRANERNLKIQHFRRKNRRVLLTSCTVPLKQSNNTLSVTSTTFILFSDCLCQLGSQLQIYPLTTIWLKIEGDTSLLLITPERKFSLTARSHLDKMIWYDHLERSIMSALGQPNVKLASVRTTAYVFSRHHAKYANVHAYGRWSNGVMHGNCYLEYPDGRCYFGEMRHGEIEGYGKMVRPSVGLYEGSFKAGKFNGYGTYEMKDNNVYEGNFRDDLFHGHGFMRAKNYTYVGDFLSNAKSGYGIFDDMVTGDKYMGMFVDNKRIGAGTCVTMNGDYFEGIFNNDELSGIGLAVFENDYYYEGELTMRGPSGKGTYYMPTGAVSDEDSGVGFCDELQQQQLIGNVLSGQLIGNWNDVRIVSGNLSLNRQFMKYPKTIGDFVVDNNRKWRSLFDNFQEEILSTPTKVTTTSTDTAKSTTQNATKNLWSRIAIYMTKQRERERSMEQHDLTLPSTHSYFAKNISLGYTGVLDKHISNSLLHSYKESILSLTYSIAGGRAQSQETLCDTDMLDFDFVDTINFQHQHQQQLPHHHSAENSLSSVFNVHLDSWANDSISSTRSSSDSIAGTANNNTISSSAELQFIPNFGINSLNEEDVAAIKEYLAQAFKDHHHPLHLLNKRIANSFYTSYGCWKVKPSPLLAKQAMLEWESISKRVYKFIRQMFPALPEDYCVLESTREVISHITLLYPIVLSEGIYSTLFVLYANKYSCKDEIYRQNLNFTEKMSDDELAKYLGIESSFVPIIKNTSFLNAIQTLKQLQEKYSPKAMLTVIENCMQLITDAYKTMENEKFAALAADSMMPLTLFLTLRAAVPHLGAELALIDDLTGGANFQFEMNGLAGYCYTTLKAAYEHITTKLAH